MNSSALAVHSQFLMALATTAGITTFVETGTFSGKTARWAASHFASVYTIECSETLFEAYKSDLKRFSQIQPLLGDSRSILPQILAELGEKPAIFWLDGHWSGGITAGAQSECPLLSELKILSRRANDIILIDDARLFLAAPGPPHDSGQWPTIAEIIQTLTASNPGRFIQIFDDIIFVVPNNPELKKILVGAAQHYQLKYFKPAQKIGMTFAMWLAAFRTRRG